MNRELAVELNFFAVCILWGGLVLLIYDLLRVIRRLIKHGSFWLAVEDLIFWIITGFLIFSMIYRQNNGIIRGYAVMGMTAGMLIYNIIVKDHLVNIIVKGIRIIIKPFAAVLKIIKKYMAMVNKKLKNSLKVLLKQLKLSCKSIKMKISRKKHDKSAKKHQNNRKKIKNSKKGKSSKLGKAESTQEQIHKSGPVFMRLSQEELRPAKKDDKK